MPFIDSATLRAKIAADFQKTDPTDLAIDDGTLDSAVEFAKAEILSRLQQRGYTVDNVTGWGSLAVYQEMLAKWYVFTVGGVPHGYSDLHIKSLDVTKRLDDVGIMVDGVLIRPGIAGYSDPGGSAGYGSFGKSVAPALEW